MFMNMFRNQRDVLPHAEASEGVESLFGGKHVENHFMTTVKFGETFVIRYEPLCDVINCLICVFF